SGPGPGGRRPRRRRARARVHREPRRPSREHGGNQRGDDEPAWAGSDHGSDDRLRRRVEAVGTIMIYRPIGRSEVERLRPLVVPDPASPLTATQFQVRFENGEYRPEWAWIAEEEPGEPPVAAAIWWGTARD